MYLHKISKADECDSCDMLLPELSGKLIIYSAHGYIWSSLTVFHFFRNVEDIQASNITVHDVVELLNTHFSIENNTINNAYVICLSTHNVSSKTCLSAEQVWLP